MGGFRGPSTPPSPAHLTSPTLLTFRSTRTTRHQLLPIPQLQHKLDVLRGNCDATGRNYHTIKKQIGCNIIVRTDPAQVAAEVTRFAAERQLPVERARSMVMAGTPDEVTAHLTPYLNLGFDLFILLERTPLDHETLALFIQQVAPRLREVAGRSS